MSKITPFMWFDDQAEEAARLYTSIFKNSRIGKVTHYGEALEAVAGKKAGTVMTVAFQLEGQNFVGLNGGPHFKFTPAVSFFVACGGERELDEMWQKLGEGGSVLMPLEGYPFAEKFGWLADRFGVSWQLILGERKQKITPFLLFVGDKAGRAEEALNFYVSLFENSAVEAIERFGAGEQEPEGSVKQAVFALDGCGFRSMDSHLNHRFTFSPAISFVVRCKSQAEIDRFWNAFTWDGVEEQCGWLRDKFGVSWQITPDDIDELFGDPQSSEAVTKAIMPMKKVDIATLRAVYARETTEESK